MTGSRKNDAASLAKQQADRERIGPRAISLTALQRLRVRESLYADVARLESDARAMPPRHRRRNALNTEADAVRALADLFHD